MGLKIDRTASKMTKIIGAIVGIALLACLIKILVWEHSYYQNKSSETRNPQQAVITELADAANPSEIEPTAEELKKHQTYTTTPLGIPAPAIQARVATFL